MLSSGSLNGPPPGKEPLEVLETPANKMTFSPDSRYLVAKGDSSPVQIWNLPALRRERRSLGLDWGDDPRLEGTPEVPSIVLHDERP